MSTLELLRQNRQLILAAATRHGAGNVRVFGSAVRHEDQADSDIDLLVDMAPDHDLLDIIALARELEELLSRKADVVSGDELSPYLRERIMNEAVAV